MPDNPMGIVTLALVAAALAVAYYIHAVRLMPFKKCRTCKGTGARNSAIFRNTHKECRSCQAKGRFKRALRKGYERRHPDRELTWGEPRTVWGIFYK